MLKVQLESVSERYVLIDKDTLEKLIDLAQQVDEIEISEVRDAARAKRGSLRGIWKGGQVSEEMFLDARLSLFRYEEM